MKRKETRKKKERENETIEGKCKELKKKRRWKEGWKNVSKKKEKSRKQEY